MKELLLGLLALGSVSAIAGQLGLPSQDLEVAKLRKQFINGRAPNPQELNRQWLKCEERFAARDNFEVISYNESRSTDLVKELIPKISFAKEGDSFKEVDDWRVEKNNDYLFNLGAKEFTEEQIDFPYIIKTIRINRQTGELLLELASTLEEERQRLEFQFGGGKVELLASGELAREKGALASSYMICKP